jgi:hypothetical protein
LYKGFVIFFIDLDENLIDGKHYKDANFAQNEV